MNQPKTVCLVTYCRSGNYGAALQLYATYRAVESLGHKPVVLSYENAYEASQNSWRFLLQRQPLKRKLRTLVGRYVFGAGRNGRRNFEGFYAGQMAYTQPVASNLELGGISADVFCVGSDQVWNPQITDSLDPVFLLDHPGLRHKISFSSSMGSLRQEIREAERLQRCLEDFSYIGVRENRAQVYLQRLLGRQVQQTLDPTLLFTAQEWKQMLRLNEKPPLPEPYVLIYALGDGFGDLNRLAQAVAGELEAKVAVITLSDRKKNVDYCIRDATPEDFVRLIGHAAFVVTNSFHGTCFSLIFGRPFYSVKFGSNPKRVEELLQRYELMHRFYVPGRQIERRVFSGTDVQRAALQLSQDRKESLAWLREAIEDGA